jgi:hypothetical protein
MGLKEIMSEGVNWIHLAQEEITAGPYEDGNEP